MLGDVFLIAARNLIALSPVRRSLLVLCESIFYLLKAGCDCCFFGEDSADEVEFKHEEPFAERIYKTGRRTAKNPSILLLEETAKM